MEYKFTINDFEGPLDLLLHLIKQSNIDICDINIVEITEQYLSFIEQEQNLNLNIASEYLIMAAELMELKSKILLPKQEKNIDEEIDSKENLINKLIEYNKYKNIIPQLKELNSERNTIYTKLPENLNYLEKEKNDNEEDEDLDSLLACLTPREKDIIKMYYLDGDKSNSYQIIANKYQISRERVRQIINSSIEKIRKNHPELYEN